MAISHAASKTAEPLRTQTHARLFLVPHRILPSNSASTENTVLPVSSASAGLTNHHGHKALQCTQLLALLNEDESNTLELSLMAQRSYPSVVYMVQRVNVSGYQLPHREHQSQVSISQRHTELQCVRFFLSAT